MNSLLTMSFWFDPTPVRMGVLFERGFFVFFALLLIGSVVARMIASNRQEKRIIHAAEQASVAMLWMSIWGFFWLFASFEEVQFFGVRAWIVLWGMVAIAIVSAMLWNDHRDRLRVAKKHAEGGVKPNPYIPRAKWRR